MNKKILSNLVFVFYMMLTITFIVFKFNGWTVDQFAGKIFDKETLQAKELPLYTKLDVVNKMHEMTNGLIVAEDNAVGNICPMNKTNIEDVLDMVQHAPAFKENNTLIKIIKDWEKGNFSHIVKDHNTVWSMLKGKVGKAKSADEAKVKLAKEKLGVK